MYRTTIAMGVAGLILLAAGHDSQAQRRGGVGGGARGGVAARPTMQAPVAGAGIGGGSRSTVIGPGGGTKTTGSGSGSYTTAGGSTINYAGAGSKGTTAGGVSGGRGVGAVQVTTPGGKTVTKAGTVGGVAGPGGNAVGTKSGVTTGNGPGGSFSTAYKGGVAVGPQGAAATGTRVGTATGPGGTVSGAARGGVATGPYGTVAAGGKVGVAAGPGGVAVGGTRTVAGRSSYGTYYASCSALVATGGAVRTNFRYYNAFHPGWYARYPGAWFAAGWTAARIWSAPGWGAVASYGSYPAEPAYYDYGESVVYSGDTVTLNGETEIPAEQYAQQATDLAEVGKATPDEPKPDDFELLGVFAMVQDGEEKSTNIFQLAVNKDGLIRGNYYNALTDTTEPVYGSVDKKTQRAAWTVANRKSPVYEAGIANLTKDETTMLVHFSKDNRQQFMLIRIQQPEGEQEMGDKK